MEKGNFDAVLLGAPNCGKTTLFNCLTGMHRTTGNRPGVTVSETSAEIKPGLVRHRVTLSDLPGVYSLSGVSPDEKTVTFRLREKRPDIAVFVADAGNLARGLYPAVMLAGTGIPFVLALNMADEAAANGIVIDTALLSRRLGCPVVLISAKKREGIAELTAAVDSLLSSGGGIIGQSFPSDPEGIHRLCDDIVGECVCGRKNRAFTDRIDSVVLGRWTAFPVFFLIMTAVYLISVSTLGKFLSDRLIGVIAGEWIRSRAAAVLLSLGAGRGVISLVTEGVIGGVGLIAGFLPQFVLLYFMLSLLEESGYMSRAVVMTDRLFAAVGLSGRCCIPMIVGSGCSVPGIMSARIIDDRRERETAVMTASFVPCGAKLPVISLAAGCVFDGEAWVAPSVYLVGIAAVFVTALVTGGRRKGRGSHFAVELPDYRVPSMRSVMKSTAARSLEFLKKAATVIFLAGLFVWALSSVALSGGIFTVGCPADESLLAVIGRFISPVFMPLGFGFWEASAATVMGLAAKEELAAVFGVLDAAGKFSRAGAYSFLVFNILNTPCAAAVSAMKQELGGRKLIPALVYQVVFAYFSAFAAYSLMKLIL